VSQTPPNGTVDSTDLTLHVGTDVQGNILYADNGGNHSIVSLRVIDSFLEVPSLSGATFTAVSGYGLGSYSRVVNFIPSLQTPPPSAAAARARTDVTYLTLDASSAFATTTDVDQGMFFVVPTVQNPTPYTSVGNRFCMTPSSVVLIHVKTGRKITVTPSAFDTPINLDGATPECG
jgi:hypothetical protein